MKSILKHSLWPVLIVLVGCSHIPFMGKSSEPPVPVESDLLESPPSESVKFIDEGRIVHQELLRKGAGVAIIPFKAGAGVEANETLDKIALMIVRGMSDAFKEGGGKRGYFNILTAEDSRDPDLIIQGHVTDMQSPSKVSRWVLLKSKKRLGVKGKVIDAKTGETVVMFAHQAKTEGKQEDYPQLGHRMGEDIGRFILSGVEGMK